MGVYPLSGDSELWIHKLVVDPYKFKTHAHACGQWHINLPIGIL